MGSPQHIDVTFNLGGKFRKFQRFASEKPIPQNLPGHLRSRIIVHITLIDKKYATYINIIDHSGEQSLPTELFLG
ncbi:hypothetical protein AGMMS49579_23630 [Spirochaetia bacterium]|nr:hypothetical protein AGMMS49579_23630 [Spirochaetia bacterium]